MLEFGENALCCIGRTLSGRQRRLVELKLSTLVQQLNAKAQLLTRKIVLEFCFIKFYVYPCNCDFFDFYSIFIASFNHDNQYPETL